MLRTSVKPGVDPKICIGGASPSLFPLPSPLLPLSSLLSPPFPSLSPPFPSLPPLPSHPIPFPSLPSPPLRSRPPVLRLGGLGERLALSSPSGQTVFGELQAKNRACSSNGYKIYQYMIDRKKRNTLSCTSITTYHLLCSGTQKLQCCYGWKGDVRR